MRGIFSAIADYIRECDKILFALCIAATSFGCLAVFSATHYLQNTRQLLVQAVGMLLGIVAVIVISGFDYNNYKKIWPILAGVSLLLVGLTFFIGYAPAGTDDKAWLMLPGGITFQPSEILKVAFIITFSIHIEYLGENMNRLRYLVPLLLHAAVPILLIHLQGDDGSALIFAFIFLFMLFCAGLKLRYFIIFAVAVAVAAPFIYFLVMNADQQARVLTMFNLEADLKGAGWQQWRGRIALASGGIFGQGYLKGALTQTGEIPEGYNDFIITSIGEELGLLGCVVVMLLLGAICLRIMRVGTLAREKRGKLMCVGVFAMIFSQAVINLGMCFSLLPVIGVTLPFFSAGGTSLVCLYCGIGVVMSVYMHRNNRLMRLFE